MTKAETKPETKAETKPETKPKRRIQLPTVGRMVYYGYDGTVTTPNPAQIMHHYGEGFCLLAVTYIVRGDARLLRVKARFGESSEGMPSQGHWCYPKHTTETIEVE